MVTCLRQFYCNDSDCLNKVWNTLHPSDVCNCRWMAFLTYQINGIYVMRFVLQYWRSINLITSTHILFRICPHCMTVCNFSSTDNCPSTITFLEQKSPGQETGLGLKVLNDANLVLNEHDYEWPPHLESLHLVSFRTFLNLRKVPW